jgi:hypothetical protein
MEYTLTRFKPSGKWYDDTLITILHSIRWILAFRDDGNTLGISRDDS